MYSNVFEQFQLVEISAVNTDLVISNAFIFAAIVPLFYLIISTVLVADNKLHFNFYKTSMKTMYSFFYELVESYVGVGYANRYFPFFFYLFLFIVTCNLIGLVPYSFTLTSHLFVNFSLSAIVWFGIFFIGLSTLGLRYFQLFCPKGISPVLTMLLVVIEFISGVFRMFSLAVRLLANMVAGHLLLDCIVFYIYSVINKSFLGTSVSVLSLSSIIIPSILFIVLILFETFVCFLQAYIFVILSLLYLKEVI